MEKRTHAVSYSLIPWILSEVFHGTWGTRCHLLPTGGTPTIPQNGQICHLLKDQHSSDNWNDILAFPQSKLSSILLIGLIYTDMVNTYILPDSLLIVSCEQ